MARQCFGLSECLADAHGTQCACPDDDFIERSEPLQGESLDSWLGDLAVQAYPPYAECQTKTDRLIPVFVLE